MFERPPAGPILPTLRDDAVRLDSGAGREGAMVAGPASGAIARATPVITRTRTPSRPVAPPPGIDRRRPPDAPAIPGGPDDRTETKACESSATDLAPDGRGVIVRANVAPTYRLLLVSEHRGASEALTTHLTRHGFAIVGHESSPGRAADAARRERPDVVLLDASVAAGWQAVVAAMEGLVARGHVAVLSAYWSSDARRSAASSGIGATLLKGGKTGELVERLRSLAAAA
jgi:hypothetical protein